MRVGTVGQIWRYPVKSMQGETVATATVGERGVPGDRCWALRDELRGGIASARRIGALLTCTAVYPDEPEGDASGTPPVEMLLNDGSVVRSDEPDADARLSRAIGQEVSLWPLQPAEDEAHYLPGQPLPGESRMGIRDIFGLEPGEPVPDLSALPEELWRFVTPPGTYWDALPLLALTDTTLESLHGLAPASRFDVRRFRPNIFIHAETKSGFPEQAWVGGHLRVGHAVVHVALGCPRCVMTTRPFADLPADRAVLRTITRHAGQKAGIYASVVEPGAVSVGDPVELD